MDVFGMDSGVCIDQPATITNGPGLNGGSSFKGKTVKIVVAARQYKDGTVSGRGYGDIASGVRGLGYIKKLFPEAKCSFVFEHFADDSDELERLISIATVDGVKPYILNGLDEGYCSSGQPSVSVDQEPEVCQLLQEADFIFHGPSGLIAPLALSNGEYAHKTIGVSEYEDRTGNYENKGQHGIAECNMGVRYNRLYLMEQPCPETEFKDDSLRYDCATPASKITGESDKKPFYFAYGHSYLFLAQMLRILVLMEGDNKRDVVLVSSGQLDLHKDNQDFMGLLPEYCPYKSVKVFQIDNNGKKIEIETFNNPNGQQRKNIQIITPDRLKNSDFFLLQKWSEINYSSGDISTSDVLSKGRIPIVDPYKKRNLFLNFQEEMRGFCRLPDNGQYSSLIDPWIIAAYGFCNEARKKFPRKKKDEIDSLRKLLSPQWQAFELKFTDWLKQNNKTEAFIREKAEAIIHKTASGG